MRIVAKVI